MTKIEITNNERIVLKQYIKTSPLNLLRYKSQAILMASKGAIPEIISEGFNRTPHAVGQWLSDWQKCQPTFSANTLSLASINLLA